MNATKKRADEAYVVERKRCDENRRKIRRINKTKELTKKLENTARIVDNKAWVNGKRTETATLLRGVRKIAKGGH